MTLLADLLKKAAEYRSSAREQNAIFGATLENELVVPTMASNPKRVLHRSRDLLGVEGFAVWKFRFFLTHGDPITYTGDRVPLSSAGMPLLLLTDARGNVLKNRFFSCLPTVADSFAEDRGLSLYQEIQLGRVKVRGVRVHQTERIL